MPLSSCLAPRTVTLLLAAAFAPAVWSQPPLAVGIPNAAPAAATAARTAPAPAPAAAPMAAPQALTVAPAAPGMQSIEQLVAQAAQRHGYRLSWEARPLAVPFVPVPVGADIGIEMRMLQRQLGFDRSPLRIEIYRGSSVLRVLDADRGGAPLRVTDEPFAGPLHSLPVAAAQVAVAPVTASAVAPVTASAVAEQPAHAAPTRTSYQVAPGLAQAAFAQVAARHQYRLDWAVAERDGVYAHDFPVTLPGRSLTDDLTVLARALGVRGEAHFRVEVFQGNQVVRVTTRD